MCYAMGSSVRMCIPQTIISCGSFGESAGYTNLCTSRQKMYGKEIPILLGVEVGYVGEYMTRMASACNWSVARPLTLASKELFCSCEKENMYPAH